MPTLKHVVATNLRKIIGERGISQQQLANALGVSFQTVNGLINERSGISGKMISELAAHFGIEETDLVAAPVAREITPDEAWEVIRRLDPRAALRTQAPPMLRAAEPSGDPLAGLSAEARARIEKLIEYERLAGNVAKDSAGAKVKAK